MELKELFALVDYLVDEKLNEITIPNGKRGIRGPRGLDGEDGTRGSSGKSFIWDEHAEEIFNKIKENKLKFSDLTDDEKNTLRGPRGQRGKPGISGENGVPGESFVWENHVNDVYKLLEENKDNFRGDDGELGPKGDRGLRGYKGIPGRDGKPGNDGESFIWENFQDKIFDRIDKNKLTFKKLSENEIDEIKGERGPRGQRGRVGNDGLSAYDIWSQENEGSTLDFLKSIKGIDGKNGINGLNGKKGEQGINGFNGEDGEDAPFIIDIRVEERKGSFYFVFDLSDGSRIETNSVDKPRVESILQSTVIQKGGGSGGGVASELDIYKDNILLGVADELDFVGDNINVVYDLITKRATISVDEPTVTGSCIKILDEHSTISECAKSIDFVGSNVVAENLTHMSDWALLSDVTSLSGYEVVDPGTIRVTIGESLEQVSADGGSGSNTGADKVPIGSFISLKYFIAIKDIILGTVYSFDMRVNNENGSLSSIVSGRVGNMNVLVNPVVDGSDMVLEVINNEVNEIEINIYRLSN